MKHQRGRSLYHMMTCPPTKQQPKPKTVQAAPTATASPAPTNNTIQVGGFTVTPEDSPTAQLADYQWLKATEKVVPLDWSSTSRYISVVGTGKSERSNPVVYIAMEDVPKENVTLHCRVATAVENEEASENLARKKRIQEFVEKQARLAITGLPGRSTTARSKPRTPSRRTRTTPKGTPPSRDDTAEMTQATGPEQATPRRETSNTSRPDPHPKQDQGQARNTRSG